MSLSPSPAVGDQLPPTIGTVRGIHPPHITVGQQTVRASVDPNGDEVTDCHVDWGPASAGDFTDRLPCSPSPGAGSAFVDVLASFHVPVTGLYRYRFVAVNGGGAAVGGTGTVMAYGLPPAVMTGPASAVTAASVTLNGRVDPNGSAVTNCHFEYGATSAYGERAPCATAPGGGDLPVPASATVPWPAGVLLHFRLVAANGSGTAFGHDSTVLVIVDLPLPDPPAPEPPTEPPFPQPQPSAPEPAAVGMLAVASIAHAGGGRFAVTVSCVGQDGCDGVLSLSAQPRLHGRRRTVVLGTAPYALSAGERETIEVHLVRRGRRILAHHPRLHVKATAPATVR